MKNDRQDMVELSKGDCRAKRERQSGDTVDNGSTLPNGKLCSMSLPLLVLVNAKNKTNLENLWP